MTPTAMTLIVQLLLPNSSLSSLGNCNLLALWHLGVPIWDSLSCSCCASPFITLWQQACQPNAGGTTARYALVVNDGVTCSSLLNSLTMTKTPLCGAVQLLSWFLETPQSRSCQMPALLALADGLPPMASCGESCIRILLIWVFHEEVALL